MELLIVRHGESVANAQGRMQGQHDYPLSETGAQQAVLLGRWLRRAGFVFDAAYSSPLSRALATALTRDEISASYPGFLERAVTDLGDFSDYGGESYDDVQARVRSLLLRWQAKHREAAHRILAVAHGGTNFHLVKALVCEPVPRVMSLKFGNCTATLVRMRERRGHYLGEVVFHLPVDLLGAASGEGMVGVF
jgi:broad specificity phosphatase PhoE